MRVVGGELKGRVIEAPDGRGTRPTTDRVRESVFSSVYSRLPDLSSVEVLDAFAGSGALGIEALSRGACRCTFFERDANARRVLAGNLRSLGLEPACARVRGEDVLKAVHGPLTGGPFGLVLLDPPYALESAEVERFLEQLAANGDIGAGTVVVYEHAHENSKEVRARFEENASFEVTGLKKYGKIGVLYLECT